jgi:ADP-heptose:LPS heptosyltransferase
LCAGTLRLGEVWDSGAALWAALHTDQGPLPAALGQRLASCRLAVVYTPRPPATLLARLGQAGIPAAAWVPSFLDSGVEPVARLQARHLAALGLKYDPQPFSLQVEAASGPADFQDRPEAGPWVAVAPGSGQPLKNWPLSHYYELTRELAWQHQARVVWLLGPAERALLPYVQALAQAQGQLVLSSLSLSAAAAVLARCHLYIGNDSGLTHLATAAGSRRVVALFGPTDPRTWAPFSPQVTILTTPAPCHPCAQGRDLSCPHPACLQDLSPATVLAQAADLLQKL